MYVLSRGESKATNGPITELRLLCPRPPDRSRSVFQR
ncbi:unnamed protein product [Brassica oleracea]